MAKLLFRNLVRDHDFDTALKFAEFIDSETVKVRYFLNMALLQYKLARDSDAKATIEKALESAWRLPNHAWINYQRDYALKKIVPIQTLLGLHKEAFQNVQYIENADARKRAIRDIAMAKIYLGDLGGAIEIIWPLQDPQYMLDVAEVIAGIDENPAGRPKQGLCTLEVVARSRDLNLCDHLFK